MLAEASKAAVRAIRQGGEWQFLPLTLHVRSELISDIKYLFHGTDKSNIHILEQPYGAANDGYELYKDGVELAYRRIDIFRLRKLPIIRRALTTSVVLAEIWSRFHAVGTIMVSKPLSDALKSRDPAKALELSQYIQANAILALFSAFAQCHPDLFLDFLMPIVLPIVYALYDGFTVCLYQSPTISFNSLVQCLFTHLPAQSQLNIPDDVSCLVTLPPTCALYDTAPSSSTLRLPSSGDSRSSAAAGPVLANVGKRKHSLVEEQQTPNTENKKMKPLAMAESKARGERQKENIPPTPASSIFQTSSKVQLGSSANGGVRCIPRASIVRLALLPRTSISPPSGSSIGAEVSGKRKRHLVDEQQRETEGDKKQRHAYAMANGNENIASTSTRMTAPTSPEVEAGASTQLDACVARPATPAAPERPEAEDATGQEEQALTQDQQAKKTERNRKKRLRWKLNKALKKANIGSNSANASTPASLAVTHRPQTGAERNRKKHRTGKAKKANKRLGSAPTHTTP